MKWFCVIQCTIKKTGAKMLSDFYKVGEMLTEGLAPARGYLKVVLTGSQILGERETCASSSTSQAPSVWPRSVVRDTDGKIIKLPREVLHCFHGRQMLLLYHFY